MKLIHLIAQALRLSAFYFILVVTCGALFGSLRASFSKPAFGTLRYAELLEMPIMLFIIWQSAKVTIDRMKSEDEEGSGYLSSILIGVWLLGGWWVSSWPPRHSCRDTSISLDLMPLRDLGMVLRSYSTQSCHGAYGGARDDQTNGKLSLTVRLKKKEHGFEWLSKIEVLVRWVGLVHIRMAGCAMENKDKGIT